MDAKQKTPKTSKLSISTKTLWRSRLDHPSDKVIRHLTNASTGIKITNDGISKSKPGEPHDVQEPADRFRQRIDEIIEVIEIPRTTYEVDELLHFTSFELPDSAMSINKETEPDPQLDSQLLTPETTLAPEFTTPIPSSSESTEQPSTHPFDIPLPALSSRKFLTAEDFPR
jgi:hypothetical protein